MMDSITALPSFSTTLPTPLNRLATLFSRRRRNDEPAGPANPGDTRGAPTNDSPGAQQPPPSPPPKPRSRTGQWLLRACIFVFVTVFLMSTGGDIGITNDAPGWVIAPSQKEGTWIMDLLTLKLSKVLDKQYTAEMWTLPIQEEPNQAFPPFPRIWHWAWWKVSGKMLGFVDGYRLGPAAFYGVFLAILLPWLGRRYGGTAATVAGGALLLSPRLYECAQFIATDMPTAAVVVLATLAFIRGLETGKWTPFFVLYGIGFLCKLTAAFMPVPLLIWALFVSRRNSGLKLPNAFGFILQWAAISGVVIILGWPDMWKNPLHRLFTYMSQITAPRGGYLYLGAFYSARSAYDFIRYTTPWHYPFVIILTTTPVPILVLMAAGLARAIVCWRRDPLPALIAASGLFYPFLVAYQGGFAAERPFLPGMYFLYILAGLGAAYIVELCASVRRTGRPAVPARAAAIGVTTLTLCATLWSLATVWPFGSAYHNILFGGARGAAARGMESLYWHTYLNPSLCRFLNSKAPATVAIINMVTGSLSVYQADGTLKRDVALVDMKYPGNIMPPQTIMYADYYIVCGREPLDSRNYVTPGFPEILDSTVEAAYSVKRDGVYIMKVFARSDLFRALASAQQPPVRSASMELGAVSLTGIQQPVEATMRAGEKANLGLAFAVNSTNTPINSFYIQLLDQSGRPVRYDEKQRRHRQVFKGNDMILNPDYGAPLSVPYSIPAYPDMNQSLDPRAFGEGARYAFNIPVKIPANFPEGDYRVVLTDRKEGGTVQVDAGRIGVKGRVNASPAGGILAGLALTGGTAAALVYMGLRRRPDAIEKA